MRGGLRKRTVVYEGLVHELFDMDDAWNIYVLHREEIVARLTRVRYRQLAKDIDWDTDERMWKRLEESIEKNEDVIDDMQDVIDEHVMQAANPERGRDFISLLEWRGFRLMYLYVRLTGVESMQVYVTLDPIMWIYKQMQPKNSIPKGVSILLHSITAFTMKTLHPELERVRVFQPFVQMREILIAAQETYGFVLTVDKDDPKDMVIDLTTQFNFLEAWKQFASRNTEKT